MMTTAQKNPCNLSDGKGHLYHAAMKKIQKGLIPSTAPHHPTLTSKQNFGYTHYN
jgi:hypothetical protein